MNQIIRKLPIQVEVVRAGQAPEIGLFFLSSRGLRGSGPETLLELLNRSEERMIPFERECDGATLLISRSRIERVRLLAREFSDLMHPRCHDVNREELVAVRFAGGGEIEGLIQLELHDTTSRASDFVNGQEAFFSILSASGLCLVNKDSIIEIRVFEASPLPLFPERSNGN